MLGKGTHVSVFRIMEEINQNHKYLSGEVQWQDVINWVGKYIGIIGVPNMYHDKTTGEHPLTPHVSVTDYRGELPVDFVTMKPGGVRDAETHEVYAYGGDSFTPSYPKVSRTEDETDVTLKSERPLSYEDHKTYSLNNYYIIISDEEKTLELAYKAILLDENGYPMIPDNERVIEGCVWFIVERVAMNLWSAGLMTDKVFDHIKQERAWAMGSAQSAAVTMTPDEMQRFQNAWARLNPVVHQFDYSFRFTGLREDLNIGSG